MFSERKSRKFGCYVVGKKECGWLTRPVDSDVQKDLEDYCSEDGNLIPKSALEWDALITMVEERRFKDGGPINYDGQLVSSLYVDQCDRAKIIMEVQRRGYDDTDPSRVWDDMIRMVRPLVHDDPVVQISEYRIVDLLNTYSRRRKEMGGELTKEDVEEDNVMMSMIGTFPCDFDLSGGPPVMLNGVSDDEIKERIFRAARKIISIHSYNFVRFMEVHGFEIKNNRVLVCREDVPFDPVSGRVLDWSKARRVLDQWMRLNCVQFSDQEITKETYFCSGLFLLNRDFNGKGDRVSKGSCCVDYHPLLGSLFDKMRALMIRKNFRICEGMTPQSAIGSFIERFTDRKEKLLIVDFYDNWSGSLDVYSRFVGECCGVADHCSCDAEIHKVKEDKVVGKCDEIVESVMCGPFMTEVDGVDGSDLNLGLVESTHRMVYENEFVDVARNLGYNVHVVERGRVGVENGITSENFIVATCLSQSDLHRKIIGYENVGIYPTGWIVSLRHGEVDDYCPFVRMMINYAYVKMGVEMNGMIVLFLADKRTDYVSCSEMLDLLADEDAEYVEDARYFKNILGRCTYYGVLSQSWYQIESSGSSISYGSYDTGCVGEHNVDWGSGSGGRYITCRVCGKLFGFCPPGGEVCSVIGVDVLDVGGRRYMFDPPSYGWKGRRNGLVVSRVS